MWITVASFQTFEDLWRHRNIDSKANPKCAKVSFMTNVHSDGWSKTHRNRVFKVVFH